MELHNQIKFYDERWNSGKKLNSLKLLRAVKILEYLAVVKKRQKQLRILDLGCGDGKLTSFIGEFGFTDGLELSELAVKNAQKAFPHVNFFQGDALTYDLEDNYYDVVISQEVIEHIDNQSTYMEVCRKVLKEGGFLILSTPNKFVFDHLKGGNWSNQPIENLLTPKQLKKLTKEHFEIIKYSSIIINFGKEGSFGIINHKYIIGVFNRLNLNSIREAILSRLGFGLHQCILAQKKN